MKNENIFSIRKILYTKDKKITLIKNHTFKVTKNTIEVQYLCNDLAIFRQFMLPFNEIYHLLDTEFVSEVMKKDKDWFVNNIYVFISFTLRDNVIYNNLPYENSNNLDKMDINDEEYKDLFSITYKLGRENVLRMYDCFISMDKEYKLNIKKVAYTKIHRLTNSLDSVNLVDFNKFKNLTLFTVYLSITESKMTLL